ncbi:general transcription factor 3C polypeptide 2 isoform X1 [Hippocampus comes]|uniref:general transcription factor 3C polypeptide 2 isoform X1 n=1 Tax=Hippocampus comes TaxID=109280 RepID=UPI00094EC131|nr:PREDICTED: general transcription factor 3C polypeptide 2 isoform X1 [Hippocampus comes]XP_019738212.1 PREDICTED: general transcription factor 3C polypeptide 2 isoform X1 [Hippocampus comes]XP_019738213.1 PREDICTED: general transcription factor 3C polypeptide 2 isoform X1 [Hippocampus comes]
MVKETVPEDVANPEQGQKTPSKAAYDLTPSSRGRLRKKNSRYLDYDTSETNEEPKDEELLARKPRAVATVAKPPGKTPGRKVGRPRKVPLASADVCTSPHVANGNLLAHTNVSPSPITEESLENGTPKPKRKYVKKQIVNAELLAPSENIKEEEEPEELQPGGRPKRTAAKMAMKFLHTMVKEEFTEDSNVTSDVISKPAPETTEERKSQRKKGRKGRKRKYSDSNASEDEDFVPNVAEAEAEEEDEYEEEDEGEEEATVNYRDEKYSGSAARILKIPALMISAILETVNSHKKFCDEQLSSWVFPEWLPSSRVWHRVPSSELESYLPHECVSAAFKVSRDGCDEEAPLQRLNRFESSPAHLECWDMHLYTGGPVWAMEWCPTPDNVVASQYLALACHKDMEDQHYSHKTYPGTALVQLWDVGTLEYNTRPDSQPALAYGLVLDRGFVWHLRWCPSGGWELPTSQKEAPLLPRLGLLAVATSTCVVTIYSLPHPDALRGSQKHPDSVGDTSQPACIYKPDPVVTLKLGSLNAPRLGHSGQVLSMDWLPVKPHDIIALGFYDGMVGLWDLNTKSALLRVQESRDSPSLLPYKCFHAHEHAVRALRFCPASRHFVATAGEDRLLKTWDLRRLYGPITVQKRSLINEICWPANAAGLMWCQDSAFAANTTNGVHYCDHQMHSYYAVPRMTTVWSISYSDWLNALLTSDMVGDVILCMLPPLLDGAQYVKKTVERRFPVYLTSMEPHETTAEANGHEQEVREYEREVDDQAAGERSSSSGKADIESLPSESYEEAKRKYYLHHADNNMKCFSKLGRLWKQMKNTELQNNLNFDVMPLASLHKVRMNPNLSCHTWTASGGQAGLVRLNCIRGLNSKGVQDLIHRARSSPLDVSPDIPHDLPPDVPLDAPQKVPQDNPQDIHPDSLQDIPQDTAHNILSEAPL